MRQRVNEAHVAPLTRCPSVCGYRGMLPTLPSTNQSMVSNSS